MNEKRSAAGGREEEKSSARAGGGGCAAIRPGAHALQAARPRSHPQDSALAPVQAIAHGALTLPPLTWLVRPGLETQTRVRGVGRKRRTRRAVTKPGRVKGDGVLAPAAGGSCQIHGRPVRGGGFGGGVPDGGVGEEAEQRKGKESG